MRRSVLNVIFDAFAVAGAYSRESMVELGRAYVMADLETPGEAGHHTVTGRNPLTDHTSLPHISYPYR